MKKRIKLFDPVIGSKEEKVLLKALKSHFWASGSGIGKVSEFEHKFRKYVGAQQCVALNSGTAALHLALTLFDVKGKEVILPSLSFVSTAHAVVYNGGKPVFVDVDPHTLCLDPVDVEKAITRKTSVILPVHFGGMPCNLSKLMKLCKAHKVSLVEDAAHAAGATYQKKRIGKHGNAVCFSFHPVKNLAMPTGGAITLNGKNSSKQKNVLSSLRWCGISDRKGVTYDVNKLGWNYYMNEFSASIGLIQLDNLEKTNNIRRKIAKRYSKEIQVEFKMLFNKDCSYHLYWIQVKNRDRFIKQMEKRGIETGIHYLPIHKMSFYKSQEKLPITEKVGKNIVSIPNHPNLIENKVDYIIKNVNELA
ncbi:MAG: Glutamine--scyllo-inositol aminotransferase [Nitrosopumilales archaeon]|nr:MAG: Glutamine--scyllo-inositol aminotransferase [Nitrosopumilales archaeon]